MNRFYFDRSHIAVGYVGKNTYQINDYMPGIKLNPVATNFLITNPTYSLNISIDDKDAFHFQGLAAQKGKSKYLDILFCISPPYIEFKNEDDLIYFTMIV